MKAAVLHQPGTTPRYQDFEAPKAQGQDQVILNVKAATIKQLDRSKASGQHYTSYATLPAVVGVDGTGTLADGTAVYAMGITGMLAQQALVQPQTCIPLPAGISFEIAAALPNALLGSDAALLLRGGMQAGATVLVNGATGVTGKMAVQVAKYRGAARVIATGRNAQTLQELKALGADEVLSLKQTDADILAALQQLQQDTPIDIVMDYLWGHPASLVLQALAAGPAHPVTLVTVGEMAGAGITLPSGMLRSKPITITGSGLGALSMQQIGGYMKNTLPQMLRLAADGQLQIDLDTHLLQDIEQVWDHNPPGKRVVITI